MMRQSTTNRASVALPNAKGSASKVMTTGQHPTPPVSHPYKNESSGSEREDERQDRAEKRSTLQKSELGRKSGSMAYSKRMVTVA
jgi:hypothetical protein